MKPIVAFVVILLVFLPLVGLAQGLGDSSSLPNVGIRSLLPSLPGLSPFDVGSVRIEPYVMVGLQRANVNFNLPAFWHTIPALVPTDISATLDIQFKEAYLWMGIVGVDALLFPNVSVYLSGEMKARKNVEVSTSQDPIVSFGVPTSGGTIAIDPLTWTGSQLEWWGIDGGVKWRLRNDISLMAGLKVEHLSFALVEPRDASGQPLNFIGSIGGGAFLQFDNNADFQTKLWIPYIGMMVRGANYRGSFLFSPFSSARIRVPLNWRQTFNNVGVTLFDFGLSWRYSAPNPGVFVEALIEYDQPIVRGAYVTFWWKGRWLRIRGEADMDTTLKIAAPGFYASLPTVSSSGVATYTDYSMAGGLKAVLPF